MAWAAFIDYFEERLASDGMSKMRSARPNWKYKSIEDVRENESEFELIKVGQSVGLCSKSQTKALHGLLNKRNECAHPSDYYPGLNDTLGFISEVLTRIEMLQGKVI